MRGMGGCGMQSPSSGSFIPCVHAPVDTDLREVATHFGLVNPPTGYLSEDDYRACTMYVSSNFPSVTIDNAKRVFDNSRNIVRHKRKRTLKHFRGCLPLPHPLWCCP